MQEHAARAEATKQVLLVDDDEDILESLKDFLEARLGPEVRVLAYRSGEEGLEALERESVDLVLSDYRMPGMDGLRFLTLARERHPAVPRMLLTAYPDLELAVRAINEAEVRRFVQKPVKPEIADFIRAALQESAETAAADPAPAPAQASAPPSPSPKAPRGPPPA